MKNIAVLGSTGSVGINALNVARSFPGRFRIIALSAGANIRLLNSQIDEFRPRYICVKDKETAFDLKKKVKGQVKVFCEEPGLEELVSQPGIDQVLVAISGFAALSPLIQAIKSGRDIALANKEALVCAGKLIVALARRNNVRILPVDSEQSAIWQCLEGEDRKRLRRVYLTASGGPFRNIKGRSDFSLKDVLAHPKWKMGRKISVDSATLMNKGLEFLETMFLFGLDKDKVRVVIHPEAVVHSMVEFTDGVVKAQLSVADMRLPIQYAFGYPERLGNNLAGLDFFKLQSLNFEQPDLAQFPCLRLALGVAGELGTSCTALNAANEVAVEEFISGKINFTFIPVVIERVLSRQANIPDPCLADIRRMDSWARQEAKRIIAQ